MSARDAALVLADWMEEHGGPTRRPFRAVHLKEIRDVAPRDLWAIYLAIGRMPSFLGRGYELPFFGDVGRDLAAGRVVGVRPGGFRPGTALFQPGAADEGTPVYDVDGVVVAPSLEVLVRERLDELQRDSDLRWHGQVGAWMRREDLATHADWLHDYVLEELQANHVFDITWVGRFQWDHVTGSIRVEYVDDALRVLDVSRLQEEMEVYVEEGGDFFDYDEVLE